MKKIVFLMFILMPCSMHCSEAKSKKKKIVTDLTRVIGSDGTSQRVLTTIDSKGRQLKTTVQIAPDGKTILNWDAETTAVTGKALIRLVAAQNSHHVGFVIGCLKEAFSDEKLSKEAVTSYVKSTGRADSNQS